jgi:hypothetical protein
MARSTFGEKVVKGWECALDAQRPPAPNDGDRWGFPQIESLSPKATSDGVIVRMRALTGEAIEFEMNAVAAKYLAANILAMGQQAGWLDNDFNIVTPSISLNS